MGFRRFRALGLVWFRWCRAVGLRGLVLLKRLLDGETGVSLSSFIRIG